MSDQPEICRNCSLCCRTIIIQLGGLNAEDTQYWSTIGYAVGQVCVIRLQCKQLDKTGLCGIYDMRPVKCRTFDVNGAACKLIRKTVVNCGMSQ